MIERRLIADFCSLNCKEKKIHTIRNKAVRYYGKTAHVAYILVLLLLCLVYESVHDVEVKWGKHTVKQVVASTRYSFHKNVHIDTELIWNAI